MTHGPTPVRRQGTLDVWDRGACPYVHAAEVVQRRLADVAAELARLQTMKRNLVTLVQRTGVPRACARDTMKRARLVVRSYTLQTEVKAAADRSKRGGRPLAEGTRPHDGIALRGTDRS